jgi:hypothetical protein
MALRVSPISKRDKERLRQLKLREEEQDRMITISNLSIKRYYLSPAEPFLIG